MATGNPPYKVTQEEACRIATHVHSLPQNRIPVIENIYKNSKINSRYFCIPDFTPEKILPGDKLFFPDEKFKMPIEDRLALFKEKAIPLVTDVCQRAIGNAGISLEKIGKIVVVSSTGFFGPGLDCELIRSLGLSRGVDRSLIGFMGCAAAVNGFRVCNDFVKNNPGKCALLCCIDLSSPHTTFTADPNDAILHAIFADGCAAAVLRAETKESAPPGTLAIYDDHACLVEGSEDGITLAINENGITCRLSKCLPQYITNNIAKYVNSFLDKHNLKTSDVDFWAVHPGGRRILESVQCGVGLSEDHCADSWAVLGEYGNMLGPSVMFVLERIFKKHKAMLAEGKPGYKHGLAFSFSPGVGCEGLLLKQI
jgi:alpha-pyrone synthase